MQSVLLVEDSVGDELLTVRALRKLDIPVRVDVTRDGAEALDYMFRQGDYAGRPDQMPAIVLLDLNLPKIGGLEVLARLRAEPRTRFVPVCILTSSDEQTDSISGYMNGANSYVRKPVKAQQFNSVVRALGLYWLTLNRCVAGSGGTSVAA
jgi:CheY-like chemotaxis protein